MKSIINKVHARKIYKAIKSNKLNSKYNNYTPLIQKQAQKLISLQKWTIFDIGSYAPILNHEIIPPFLTSKTYRYSYPYFSKENRQMNFLVHQLGEQWQVGPYGILLPNKNNLKVIPQIIFVPLICFDTSLNRVGYGGGYYDTYIRKSRKSLRACKFIGIGLELLKLKDEEIIEVNQYDQKLDFIITEDNIYK